LTPFDASDRIKGKTALQVARDVSLRRGKRKI